MNHKKFTRVFTSLAYTLSWAGLSNISAGTTLESVEVPLPTPQSIVRIAAIPDPVTEMARQVAQDFYLGLDQNDNKLIISALKKIESVIGKENLGGSYSALRWLGHAWLVTRAHGIDVARPPQGLDRAYYDYFLANDAQNLKEYLQRKYNLKNIPIIDPEQHMARRTFLEDYLLFNNPARTTWDIPDRVIQMITRLNPLPQKVIDVGAGFGYFSARFAAALGPDAVVRAVDTEAAYIDQLNEIVNKYQIRGIKPILSTSTDINVKEESDLVFISSLYHVLYAWSQPKSRDAFIESIRHALRPDGYLAILDNLDTEDGSLHGAFVTQEAVIAQMYFYGFKLLKAENLSPLRYLLIFQKKDPGSFKAPVFSQATAQPKIQMNDAKSLVHIGSLDSYDITPQGIAAARLLLTAIEKQDVEAANAAVKLYSNIIPQENFGGEYTALQWVAEYIAGNDAKKKELIKDPLAAEYLAYLSADQFKQLKLYVSSKYKLTKPTAENAETLDEKTREIGITRRQALEDFILFNNPRRENWEKSSKILELLPIHPGDTIVDLGSGPGFYSVKFAERVGPNGAVYAIDTKDTHVEYLTELAKKWNLNQLHTQLSSADGFHLPAANLNTPQQADLVFMCSLYHILYAVSDRADREGVIQSVKAALKPNGKFVVVDNGPVDQNTLPYHGPYIRQELIITQLTAYGFKLERAEQIIPQRYLLIFSLK